MMIQLNNPATKRVHEAVDQSRPPIGAATSPIIPFLLWTCILGWIARVTLFVRGRTEFSQVDIAATVQILLVVAAFLILFMSGRALAIWLHTSGTSARPLFVYSIICAVSAAWSALPEFTLYRSVEFLTMLTAIFAVLSYVASFEKAERLTLIISFLIILMTIFVNFKTKNFSMSIKFWHTNSYSASAAMVFVYCLGEYFRSLQPRRRRLKIAAFLALAAAILGTSGGSFLAIIVGMLVLALLYRNMVLATLGAVLIAIMLVINVFGDFDITSLFPYLFPDKRESEVMDLGGRVRIWAPLWEYFLNNPVIGGGFAVLSSGRVGLISADTHNSIFSVLVGTGLVGLTMVLFYGFRSTREFIQTTARRIPGAVGCTGALCTGLANSLAMPLIFSEWEESSAVFALFSALFILFVVVPFQRSKTRLSRPTIDLSHGLSLRR